MNQRTTVFMFYPVLIKRQKAIAWFLFMLFYFNFLGGAMANTFRPVVYVNKTYSSNQWRKKTINNFSNEVAIRPTITEKENIGVGSFAPVILLEKKKEITLKSPEQLMIGGPGQPEMATFKSIGADNMVNLFTGDFSYNIPLLDVGGYPVNIFYNAGITMEQEASWVGLGWNINPGVINRNMRGLPDDFNGEDVVTKEQSVNHDMTIGATAATSREVIGVPVLSNLNAGIKWNNRRGLGLSFGAEGEFKMHKQIKEACVDGKTIKDSIKTTVTAGIDVSSMDGLTTSFGLNVNLKKMEDNNIKSYSGGASIDYNSLQGIGDLKLSGENSGYKNTRFQGFYDGNHNQGISFARSSYIPSIRMPTTSFNALLAVKLGREKRILFKNTALQGFLSDSYIAKNQKIQTKPAYGFMYYDKAFETSDDGVLIKKLPDALMDFNRMNDGVYTTKTPVISLPVYTYDVFNISGEGTGGAFRGYRGNVGYVKDNKMTTSSGKGSFSLELGPGGKLHAGTTLGAAYSQTEVNQWSTNNALKENLKFKTSYADTLRFYFKNPSEKAIIDEDFYNNVGKDKLIRPVLLGDGTSPNGLTTIYSATPVLANKYEIFGADLKKESDLPVTKTSLQRLTRDKRSQVISFLTAEEADRVGLDKYIYSYKENTFLPGSCYDPNYKTAYKRCVIGDPTYPRKPHHLSEITVLEGDSKRYIYGLPVYTRVQKEVSFSTRENQTGDAKNEIDYSTGQNTIDNNSGEEKFFQRQTLENFAHSFLLTEILSPDYVDVLGDGITDDDQGSAVKFNYSCANISQSGAFESYKWRYPLGDHKATFNDGLKTDNTDNKANYNYGEKELWYLHTIESKNMVATFRVSKRNDGLQTLNENGTGLNNNICQRQLDRIDLYTKADYQKNGANAKPVKTVHFSYNYELCKEFGLNTTSGGGKLTLKSIWFTYNGSNKKSGEYKFGYSSSKNNINTNPDYNTTENDRWGNYKSAVSNPDNQSNTDYSYAEQNKAKADAYASAWNLEKILLPSGSVINIDYEADDYSYVQDKRAAIVTKIAGFGMTATSTPTQQLYTKPDALFNANCAGWDHRFVFFNLPQPLMTKQEVYEKYLKDLSKLLLKLWVHVPSDSYGSGDEPIFVYANIKDYGLVPGNNNRFYIELSPTSKGGSPIMETIVDFMRRTLPSKVYPAYKNKDGSPVKQVVTALYGMLDQVAKAVRGFEFSLKSSGACNVANLNKSTARLTAPGYTKLGGGHRVKKIIISDNWDQLTKVNGVVQEKGSFYGQEYSYTTVESNSLGQANEISSGVATYEPAVGNDENPFRDVLKYDEKQPLGPTRWENIETPIAETFFPSPMVGYSKVTVKSIHNKSNKNIKSGVGKQVNEFYTCRDFPVISDFTSFDNLSKRAFKPSPIAQIFQFKKKDLLTLTQGFRVVLNDMNGKPKASYTYPEGDDKTIINSTQYNYRTTKIGENKYKLNNIIPVMQDANGVVTNKLVGKDVEVMNDSREHYTYTYAGQIPLNAELFTVGGAPVLIPTIFRMLFRDESLYRSFTTLKVVNEYGILESVINNDKGSIVSTENMVYDAETGDVLVSKTNNEFKKPIYNFNYPAHWAETGVSPAYKNIDVTYKGVLFRNGRLESSFVNMNLFESGDELYVVDKAPAGPIPVAGCNTITGDNCEKLPQNPENRIWALDIHKDPNNTTKEFIFLDRFGTPYNGASVSFRIIRSGKRNLIGASLGSIVSQNDPIVLQPDNVTKKLTINNNTNVINASAALMKEKWKGQDMFYTKDTVITGSGYAPLHTKLFYPVDDHVTKKFLLMSSPNPYAFENQSHRGYFISSYNGNDQSPIGPYASETKSWVKFDLSIIPQGSIITGANLFLLAHKSTADGSGHSGGVDGVTHTYIDPHRKNGWENGSTFNLLLGRMQHAWPATESDAAWESIFNEGYEHPAIPTNTKPWQPTSPTGSFVGNFNISEPVTDLVRLMIADKYNKGYATAFSIGHTFRAKPSSDLSRLCFSARSNIPLGDEQPLATNLVVNYYNCSEAYPPGTEPPAGQPVVACSSTSTIVKMCKSVFTKQFMNPYVQGVLGNWRPWKSYVFYGERRQGDPNSTTNINTDGVLKDFEPFWVTNTGTNKIEPSSSEKWVWNSETTQYNRKGAQLEDHDALNRYNAAIYGYQETLPVATVNNSRLRLSAFDGFEDYGYKDDPCEPMCKPSKRHFNTGVQESMLDNVESHTGSYSLKLTGSTYNFDMPVSEDNTTLDPTIKIDVLKTNFNETIVNLNGSGVNIESGFICSTNLSPIGTSPKLEFTDGNNSAKSFVHKGKLIVNKSGVYTFLISSFNNYAALYFDNSSQPLIVKKQNNLSCVYNGDIVMATKYLNVGQVYNITVKSYSVILSHGANFTIMWKKPCETNFEIIGTPNLYLTSEVDPVVTTGTSVCYKPNQIQAISNATIDSFNLIPGKDMLAGVWVKKGGQDCKCSTYVGVTLNVKNTATGQSIGALSATSKIIEGWQLFEGKFTVPQNTSNLQLSVTADAGTTFYLDDLRIHPFNANMKSFVFDPQTLWLTSELDENNYASFYEYDDEGTLVRVKKETREGIKTIKETRSAIQSKIEGF